MKKILNVLIVIVGLIVLIGVNGYLKFDPFSKPVPMHLDVAANGALAEVQK